jgi:hypothetical protein
MKIPKDIGQELSLTRKDPSYIAAVQFPQSFYGKFEDIIDSIKDDPKEIIRYTRYLEKEIRGSYEYKSFLEFLKTHAEWRKCSLLEGVSSEDASIELHHFPFTMFDICRIVLNSIIIDKKDCSSFDIISAIVKLHFDNKVGLVPLSSTVHSLVHDGKLTLSLANIYGDWQSFAEEYFYAMTKEDHERIHSLIDISCKPEMFEVNNKVLKVSLKMLSKEIQYD